ncbi:winged helix-turn-helix transcriptional regulator [Agarilytica rhodophyticola]|uniref:winged helix-turn-helix transcriptional regulator n=1 Tax=Agarilytica rhodophyticola TaxID=1737490 RepID=UPI0024820630|nr:helix-turn-helix domain-containing protein [Agarilytica rhodophyticola]
MSFGNIKVTTSLIESINKGIDQWLADDESDACPVRDILTRVGDKWSVLVLMRLGRQPERFRSLMRAIDGISQRMLTSTLRGLEYDGLVHRQVFDTRPPSVEYSLTDMGLSLVGHISVLANWAIEHRSQIEDAHCAYNSSQADD